MGGEGRRFWIGGARARDYARPSVCESRFRKLLGVPGSRARAREDGRLKCRFRATLESGSPPLLTYIPLFAPLSCLLSPPPFHLSATVFAPLHRFLVFCFFHPPPPPRPTRRRFSLVQLWICSDLAFTPLSRYIPFAWVGVSVAPKCTWLLGFFVRRQREREEGRRKEVASLLVRALVIDGVGRYLRHPRSGPGGNSSSRSVFHLLYMQHIP